MTRLILTFDDSAAGGLRSAGVADCVIPFGLRFVWWQLPSPNALGAWLSPRPTNREPAGSHWLGTIGGRRVEEARSKGLGLIEFCERFDKVELWIDPNPNAQLQAIWLLDYVGKYANVISRFGLVHADSSIGGRSPDHWVTRRLRAVPVGAEDLETARAAWAAWRSPTPQAWLDLLAQDIGALPHLRACIASLLEELPMPTSGLGASEMRVLDLIAAGHVHPFDVFPGDRKPNSRRVFGYWETGILLDGLAHCPAPAVSGLDEGPFDLDMHEDVDRHARYTASRLTLTELGHAILAQAADFSAHNPVHRWWGGTELTNDRLWRWDPVDRTLIAP